MKTRIYTISLLTLALLVSCQNREEAPAIDKTFKLIAVQDNGADSKTVISGERSVYWEPAEEIKVFRADGTGYLFKSANTEPAASAVFSGELTVDDVEAGEELWAVYPFSDGATFDGEAITTVLPSNQVARPESFARNMNLSVARTSSNKLQFFNVGGGVRFSVTQEGIGKVIFEGLNGEILSGKVTIGFEDGIPVVKEVSGGSMFITLTPPEGETFQPGKWYYMVAIPGALEQGYKLRFYKGEDYAKKVSETPVTIKRAVFGSVAEADKGNEYEPTSTSFPETEEEWEESIALTQSIVDVVDNILNTYEDVDVDSMVNSIEKIEGVSTAVINPDATSISVMQKDSAWVVVSLYDPVDVSEDTKTSASVESFMKGKRSSRIVKEGGKALILSPFQHQFNYPILEWYEILDQYFSVNVLPDNEASVLAFRGDFLEDYDFILILTHGTSGFITDINDDAYLTTVLCTGTVYNKELAKKLIDQGYISSGKQLYRFHPHGSNETYFGVLPSILGNASFNNSAVVLAACETATKTGIPGKRKMVEAFLDHGASIVAGNDVSMMSGAMRQFVSSLLSTMEQGFSFLSAHHYAAESELAEQWSNSVMKEVKKATSKNETIEGYNIYRHTLCFPEIPADQYFWVNPYPVLKEPEKGSTELSWTCSLSPFQITWDYLHGFSVNKDSFSCRSNYISYEYSVQYNVYIDGELKETTSEKNYSIAQLPFGQHKAYVMAEVVVGEGNNVIDFYRSETIQFTVAPAVEPKAKFSRTSLVFDDTQVGQTSEMDWTITNIGDATLKVSSITVPEGFSTDFSSWSSKSLEPNDSHTFKVTFAPTEAKTYSGNLVFKSNAVNAQEAKFSVGGKGIPAREAKISMSPNTIQFSNTVVGQTAEQTVTITNKGNAPLEFTSITSSNSAFSTDFSKWSSKSLAAGSSCNLKVYFKPSASRSYSTSISIKTNAANAPDAALPVSGTGIESGGKPIKSMSLSTNYPGAYFSDLSLDFKYDSKGRLSSVGNGMYTFSYSGNTMTFSDKGTAQLNSSGQFSSITWYQTTVTFKYDSNGRLSSINDSGMKINYKWSGSDLYSVTFSDGSTGMNPHFEPSSYLAPEKGVDINLMMRIFLNEIGFEGVLPDGNIFPMMASLIGKRSEHVLGLQVSQTATFDRVGNEGFSQYKGNDGKWHSLDYDTLYNWTEGSGSFEVKGSNVPYKLESKSWNWTADSCGAVTKGVWPLVQHIAQSVTGTMVVSKSSHDINGDGIVDSRDISISFKNGMVSGSSSKKNYSITFTFGY